MNHYLFPSIFTSQMEIDFPEIISKFCMDAWKLFQDKLCVLPWKGFSMQPKSTPCFLLWEDNVVVFGVCSG